MPKKKYKPKYYGSQQLKKTEAWRIFSIYIRRRDRKCFTCNAVKKWKDLDAGHFIAGSIAGKSLFFSEENVNAQCTGCNRFRHGNGSAYALALIRKFGEGIHERLDKIRREEKEKGIICRFTKEELDGITKTYQQKLKELSYDQRTE